MVRLGSPEHKRLLRQADRGGDPQLYLQAAAAAVRAHDYAVAEQALRVAVEKNVIGASKATGDYLAARGQKSQAIPHYAAAGADERLPTAERVACYVKAGELGLTTNDDPVRRRADARAAFASAVRLVPNDGAIIHTYVNSCRALATAERGANAGTHYAKRIGTGLPNAIPLLVEMGTPNCLLEAARVERSEARLAHDDDARGHIAESDRYLEMAQAADPDNAYGTKAQAMAIQAPERGIVATPAADSLGTPS